MTHYVTETFFLPEKTGELISRIPADIYNLTHTLLARTQHECVFVPIRNLQYMAVISGHEIVFVDSQSYAYHQGEGGRIIMLSWTFSRLEQRQSLDEPVNCQVNFYHPDSETTQQRLIGDFRGALTLLDKRYRQQTLPRHTAHILKLRN